MRDVIKTPSSNSWWETFDWHWQLTTLSIIWLTLECNCWRHWQFSCFFEKYYFFFGARSKTQNSVFDKLIHRRWAKKMLEFIPMKYVDAFAVKNETFNCWLKHKKLCERELVCNCLQSSWDDEKRIGKCKKKVVRINPLCILCLLWNYLLIRSMGI